MASTVGVLQSGKPRRHTYNDRQSLNPHERSLFVCGSSGAGPGFELLTGRVCVCEGQLVRACKFEPSFRP
jgi:hypothetical protein